MEEKSNWVLIGLAISAVVAAAVVGVFLLKNKAETRNPALDLSNPIFYELQNRMESFNNTPQPSNTFKLYLNPEILFKSDSEKTQTITGDKVNQVNGTSSLTFDENSWRKDENKK